MTNKRYTESHEWIEQKGSMGTVGISGYAQNELGEIVYVELPPIGTRVKAGQQLAVLESTKSAADIYTPVSGKITSINEELKKDPSLINRFAESKGWLFQIEMENQTEIEQLMNEREYQAFIS